MGDKVYHCKHCQAVFTMPLKLGRHVLVSHKDKLVRKSLVTQTVTVQVGGFAVEITVRRV